MRIITGTARGARLKTPRGLATRPTADRIKESLFNILGRRVQGRRVLDLFAGTGNLGLEALSRGAAEAVFVDRATAPLIRENAVHTHLLDRARIEQADVFTALNRLRGEDAPFDLVFCDPPYGKGLWQRTLQALDHLPLLSPEALIVVEHGATENDVPELTVLACQRNQRYGRTTQVSIFAPHGAAQEA